MRRLTPSYISPYFAIRTAVEKTTAAFERTVIAYVEEIRILWRVKQE